MSTDDIRLIIRWLFLGGFVFLVGVGMWTIVTVTRMKREQAVAIGMLKAMNAALMAREAAASPRTSDAV